MLLRGSFGVAEDQFFKKASEYARHHGLPRVYIACNSGARVGLVEELLPKLRIHWKDVEDPSKVDFLGNLLGFDKGMVAW